MSEPAPVARSASGRRTPLRDRVAGEILAAAAQVLATGTEHVNMNEVASAAGVARGTLYRYFPSRQVLIQRLQRIAVEDASRLLEESRIEQVAPIEGLERAIRAFVDVGDAFIVGLRERRQAGGGEFDEAVLAPVRSLIERGQAERVLRDDLSAAWLAEALLALVIAGASMDSLGKEDLIASIKLLFLEGARVR